MCGQPYNAMVTPSHASIDGLCVVHWWALTGFLWSIDGSDGNWSTDPLPRPSISHRPPHFRSQYSNLDLISLVNCHGSYSKPIPSHHTSICRSSPLHFILFYLGSGWAGERNFIVGFLSREDYYTVENAKLRALIMAGDKKWESLHDPRVDKTSSPLSTWPLQKIYKKSVYTTLVPHSSSKFDHTKTTTACQLTWWSLASLLSDVIRS